MSQTIYKYPLEVADHHHIMMPAGARILCVQVQYGHPMIWALVDPSNKLTEGRNFSLYGTGHDVPSEPGEYIGTFQLSGGSLVFHLFEDK